MERCSHYEPPITDRTSYYKLMTTLRLLSKYRVLQSPQKFAALREFRRNARGVRFASPRTAPVPGPLVSSDLCGCFVLSFACSSLVSGARRSRPPGKFPKH